MSETIDNNHSNIGVDKLNSAIEAREKQLTDMVNMLADLNQQLNDTQVKNKTLTDEIEYIKEKIEKKEVQLKQELNEKELMFSKLQSLEKENDKLTYEIRKNEKPSIFNSLKKTIENAIFKNSNMPNPQTITTSKVAIQKEKEKEKDKIIKKPEDFELGQFKNSFKSEIKKEEEIGNENQDDILERIRKNLNVDDSSTIVIEKGEFKEKNRDSVDSLTDQINKNSENVFK